MKPLSEVVPGLLVIQIPIQAVCAVSVASCFSDTHKKVSQFETSVHALFFCWMHESNTKAENV